MSRYILILLLTFIFYCSNSEDESNIFLNNFYFSECKGNNSLKKNSQNGQNFEIKFFNDTLHIKHIDAIFNCCVDSINLQYDLSIGSNINLLNIYEIEYANNPCKCNCPIDLDIKFVYLNVKATIINFFVKYYNSEDSILIYSDTLNF